MKKRTKEMSEEKKNCFQFIHKSMVIAATVVLRYKWVAVADFDAVDAVVVADAIACCIDAIALASNHTMLERLFTVHSVYFSSVDIWFVATTN